MIRRTARTATLKVEASEIHLREVRDFIERLGRSAGISAVEISNCKLAVDEACTNIVRHAYHDGGGTIELLVRYGHGHLDIRIRDTGASFEFDAVQTPDLNHYVAIGKRGGLGVYLINQIMDAVAYTSRNGTNELLLRLDRRRWVDRLIPGVEPTGLTHSLRMKFFLRASLGLCALTACALGVVYSHQRSVTLRDARGRIELTARQLAGDAVSVLAEGKPYGLERTLLNQSVSDLVRHDPALVYVRVVRKLDGTVWCDSRLDRIFEPYRPSEGVGLWRGSGGEWLALRDGTGRAIWELRASVRLEGQGASPVEVGTVVLGVAKDQVTSEIGRALRRTLLLGIGVLVLGMVLISLMVNLFVRPIQRLTEGVLAIGDGMLHEEIQEEGPEEISTIARAFNEITAKFRQAQSHVVEKERLQKEMQVAREIQETLLPKRYPEVSGYDIAAFYKAAMEVGGDYYDFVVVDDDTIGVVVADVSGKGVPGSLVMTMIRTALRMEARGNYSASDVMTRMNAFVTDDMRKGMFITLFYVILDSHTRVISYSSAGHNPMLLLRAETDEVFFLNPRGFPVGISLPDPGLFGRTIDVERVQLQQDDMLLVYTDGVTEAMNQQREQYGIDRMVACLRQHGRRGAGEFIEELKRDVAAFTGEIPQHDDITVVAIKEKLRPAELEAERRRGLFDLVERDAIAVEEACRRYGVSTSTYYRWRKLRDEGGEQGLLAPVPAAATPLRRLNMEERRALLAHIRAHPDLGAKRLAGLLEETGHTVDDRVVYDELVRMRLNNKELRLAYLRRRGWAPRAGATSGGNPADPGTASGGGGSGAPPHNAPALGALSPGATASDVDLPDVGPAGPAAPDAAVPSLP
jgi:serine phosphatase RsbU (regulator of sigma subunit)/anti-sigma regulatory factor (Ser/Thr protein kinase)/transposase